MKSYLIPLMMIAGTLTSFGTNISMLAINADNDGSAIEGTFAGNGTSASSAYSFLAGPSAEAVASTFADYAVSGVDIDGDNIFEESFSFRISFSSATNINFSASLETLGAGDESLSLNESFALSVEVLNDSSLSHDVQFDGFSSLDFISLSGTDLGISSTSGNTVIAASAGDTSLGGLFIDPTVSYLNSGNITNIGSLEDWSIQFSTSPVPEPSSIAFVLGITTLASTMWYRRRNQSSNEVSSSKKENVFEEL